MSRQRFLDTISLKPTDRIAQNEWLDQPDFVMKITGIDPYEDPAGAIAAAICKLGLDMYVGLHVSGDLPHNVPLENLEAYFVFCQEYGRFS
ncbi:MAG: hypothetical protein Q7J78_04975 [Clostridiales bacterium]|nr:hypothetical protein [Clostridiales bacterium]